MLYNKAKAQPKEKAIDSFIKVRTLLNAQCKSDYAKEKVDILTKDIVKLEWSCATELESDIEYERRLHSMKQLNQRIFLLIKDVRNCVL